MGSVLPSGRVVGETDRTVHLVSPATAAPEQLTALCGLVITPGMADMLTTITGMPCPACLALATRHTPAANTRTVNTRRAAVPDQHR